MQTTSETKGITWTLSEAGFWLTFSGLTSFFIHLFPSWDDSPLGSHCLPLFYAPLLVILLQRDYRVVLLTLLTPLLNHLFLGRPSFDLALLLSLQLILFFFLANLGFRRGIPALIIGPLSYAASYLVITLALGTGLSPKATSPFLFSMVGDQALRVLPGMAILALIGSITKAVSQKSWPTNP